MKVSNYNMFFKYEQDENKRIIFNSRTGAVSIVDCCLIDFVSENLSTHVLTESSNSELRELLYENEFLVDKEFNEIDELSYIYLATKFSNSTLSLTIAPTMDCNFNCAYCYEKSVITQKYMSEEVQVKIIEFIDSHKSIISKLDIIWYGGEPLLAFSIIKKLTKSILEICSRNDISYNASMITNGYLLSNRILREFENLRITSIQITIDGTENTHNKRRPLAKGNKGTFNTIMNNLLNNKSYLPDDVFLRVNVDKNILYEANELLKYIGGIGLKNIVTPYLGKIENISDCYSGSLCLNDAQYSQESMAFNYKSRDNFDELHPYPINSTFCGADSHSAYTIDVDGNLFKCWDDIGRNNKSIGNIVNKKSADSKVLIGYMAQNPFTNPYCSKCKLLPQCLGGCPKKRSFKKVDTNYCKGVATSIESYFKFAQRTW